MIITTPPPPEAAVDPAVLRDIFRSHRNFLGVGLGEDLWYMQRQIADALDAHDRVAVKACHSSGKTRLSAGIGLSFLARYPESIVISTAPTNNQVEKQLWGEVHGLLARSRYIRFPDALQTELRITAGKHYFAGFSTNDTTKFAGFHAPDMLFILDEAPGIEDPIYDALEGNAAGGRVRVLLLGNPVVGSGKFYDIFAKQRRFWRLFTISAFDTPNLAGCYFDNGDPAQYLAMRLPPPAGHAPVNLFEVGDARDARLAYNPRPYLTTRRWVWEKIIEWGVLSSPFQSRVLGRFPSDDPNALIGLGLIEDAAPRKETEPYALDFGCDVAGPGKANTVLVTRVGDNVHRVRRWPHGKCEGQVIRAVRDDEAETGLRTRYFGGDAIGQGHYFLNTIAAGGIPVTRVNITHAAAGYEEPLGGRRRQAARFVYADQKAQRYFRLRRRFLDHTIGGVTDDDTVAQLTTLRIEYTQKGLIAMESKESMARRGQASPDEAEALMLSEYCPDLDRPPAAGATLPGSVSYAG